MIVATFMSANRLEVLIVEDEPAAWEILSDQLSGTSAEEIVGTETAFSGVDVSWAKNQDEAERQSTRHAFHIIILDDLYPTAEGEEPRHNGTDWIPRLRVNQPTALIVLFTAFGYSREVFAVAQRFPDIVFLEKHLSWPEIKFRLYTAYRVRQHLARFPSVFISYSTKDEVFASRLYADLAKHGVRCWFAPHDVQAGKKLHEQIGRAIESFDRLLLLLSEHSMNSEWVKTEIAHARQKELKANRQVLFPISLAPYEKLRDWRCFDADTGKDSAREIREYYVPDFSRWEREESYHLAFQRLVRDLQANT